MEENVHEPAARKPFQSACVLWIISSVYINNDCI